MNLLMRRGASLIASLLLVVLVCSLLGVAQNNARTASQGATDRDVWLKRKADFYRKTKFSLPEKSLRLLGPKRLQYARDSMMPSGHLPFWFDYELFKTVFNKSTQGMAADEQQARHRVYLDTCVRVLKQRTLFRMLAATTDSHITADADRFYWEKMARRARTQAGENTTTFSDNQADEARAPIEFSANFKLNYHNDDGSLAPGMHEDEQPLERALRLVRAELDQVESKNQVEHYLKAFNEVDGSAISGQLPY